MLRLKLTDLVYVEVMPTAVTATILGSQCSSLLELELVAPIVGMAGPNIAALAALTRLTRLDVRLTCWHRVRCCCVTCLARLRHSKPASRQASVCCMPRLVSPASMRGRQSADFLHQLLAGCACAFRRQCIFGGHICVVQCLMLPVIDTITDLNCSAGP